MPLLRKNKFQARLKERRGKYLVCFPHWPIFNPEEWGKVLETSVFEWGKKWLSNKSILFENIFFIILGLHSITSQLRNNFTISLILSLLKRKNEFLLSHILKVIRYWTLDIHSSNRAWPDYREMLLIQVLLVIANTSFTVQYLLLPN